MPAVGYRSTSGSLGSQGGWGWYWSSTQANSDAGYILRTADGVSDPINHLSGAKVHGFPIRCVRWKSIVWKTSFLPAVGGRYDAGLLEHQFASGLYWSSTVSSLTAGHRLLFTSSTSDALDSPNGKVFGFSIRCVR